ncbi:MAG: hypothetical protein R2851_08225 [Caldilineaceae bacterium]
MLPTFLTHYYEADTGPFRSLSALSQADAAALLKRVCERTASSPASATATTLRRHRAEASVRACVHRQGWAPGACTHTT